MTITAVVRALVLAGATPEMILAAVEAAEAGQSSAIEHRRAMDAERQRRRRHATSRDVTVTPCDTPHSPPLSPTPPNTPPISPQTTPESAREAVTGIHVSEPDHKSLSRDLIEAGGEAIVNPASAPGLLLLSDPMNWIQHGCDLQADILPAIRARCSRARPSSIRSWGYFTEAVFQARDNRLKPAPEPSNVRPTQSSRRPTSSADTMLAAFASVAARSGGDGGHADNYSTRFDDGRTIDIVANPH